MKISCKWLMDMDEGEIENLIRLIIHKEPHVGFYIYSQPCLLRVSKHQTGKAISYIYIVSGPCRKIPERAIPLHKIGQKRVAFRPNELVEWVNGNRKGHKNKLFGHSKLSKHEEK